MTETNSPAAPQHVKNHSMLVWEDAKHKVCQFMMDMTKVNESRGGHRQFAPTDRRSNLGYPHPEEGPRALSERFIELRREPNQLITYGITIPPTSNSRIMPLPPTAPISPNHVRNDHALHPEKTCKLEKPRCRGVYSQTVLYPGIDAEERWEEKQTKVRELSLALKVSILPKIEQRIF